MLLTLGVNSPFEVVNKAFVFGHHLWQDHMACGTLDWGDLFIQEVCITKHSTEPILIWNKLLWKQWLEKQNADIRNKSKMRTVMKKYLSLSFQFNTQYSSSKSIHLYSAQAKQQLVAWYHTLTSCGRNEYIRP